MNKFFLERIKIVGFNESVSQMAYFRELPNNLVRLIMSLSEENFINYISFIVKLRRNGLLTENEEKLIRISNLFILKMNSYNTRDLMVLISNTKILEHKQVINFSTLLLQLTNEEQIYAIYEVISNINNLNKTNLINLIQMVNRTKNKLQLNELVKLIRSDIRNHKYFINFTEIILKNPDNINYLYLNNCLKCEEFLNHKDILLLLNKYLMTSKDRVEADLIYTIVTNKSMLKSSYLFKLLDTIKDEKARNYLPSIKRIVLCKDNLCDNSFDYLLTALFKVKSQLQLQAVLSILNFNKLCENPIQLSYVLNKCLNIENSFQLETLKIILNKIIISDNFDLYKENNMSIIETIINSKKDNEIMDYQAFCLAKSFEYLINSKYRNTLINKITMIKDKVTCYYVSLLLQIDDIQELIDFEKILNEFIKFESKFKMKTIIILLIQDKIIKSNNYLRLIYLINRIDDYEVRDILKIINRLPSINDKNIFKFLEIVINEKDFDRRDTLVEIVSNYHYLKLEKTLNYVELVKGVNKKSCQEIVENLRSELNEICEKESNETSHFKVLGLER